MGENLKGLPLHAVEILEYLAAHERITTKEAAEITGSGMSTAKGRLKKLVRDGFFWMLMEGAGVPSI